MKNFIFKLQFNKQASDLKLPNELQSGSQSETSPMGEHPVVQIELYAYMYVCAYYLMFRWQIKIAEIFQGSCFVTWKVLVQESNLYGALIAQENPCPFNFCLKRVWFHTHNILKFCNRDTADVQMLILKNI